MTQSRPPRTFPGLTEEQSAGIFAELDRIRNDVGALSQPQTTRIHSEAQVTCKVGDVLRLLPRNGTQQRAFLPPPPRCKVGDSVDLLVDCSQGGTVAVSSSNTTVGLSVDGHATVNRERTHVITTTGWYRFECDGQRGWFAGPTGPAGAAGAAGATGATGATGADSAFRQLFKQIFFADGTYELYDSTNTLLSSGAATAWSTTSESKTAGNAYKVWLCAGGTGGNRSVKTTAASVTDVSGASAPGGAAVHEQLFSHHEIAAYITALGTSIPVTVGSGGAGAAVGTIQTAGEAGALGTLGGVSAFGGLCAAYPGGRGNLPSGSSSSPGAGGGGWVSAGADGGTNGGDGGQPNANVGDGAIDSVFGGGHGHDGTNNSANSPGASVWGGGGGGGSAGGSAVNGLPAGRSLKGCPGAGSGGSLDGTGPTARTGGAAGKRGFDTTGGTAPTLSTGGGPAGGAGATGNGATDGTDGADGILGLYPGESGAGGGALICNAGAGTQLSGRGGDGGFPGGSGGSSGACFTASGAAVACGAGRGGTGADGVLVVFSLG